MRMSVRILAYIATSVFVYSILKHISVERNMREMEHANTLHSDRSNILNHPSISRENVRDVQDLDYENTLRNSQGRPKNHPPSKKYLVYTCYEIGHCGSWSDRLRGIFSTYIMARLTDREFIINMTSPCPLTTFFHPDDVLWNTKIDKLAFSDQAFIDARGNTSFGQLLEVADLSTYFNHDVVKLSINRDLYSHLKANPRYRTKLSRLFGSRVNALSLVPALYKRLFTFNDELNSRVSTFLTKLLGKRRKLICVQRMVGHNFNTPVEKRIEMLLSELPWLLEFMEQYRDIKRYIFFVSTDSETFQREAKRRFPKQIIDIHGQNYHGNQKCGVMGNVILTQYLLKYCDTLVISNTAYGQIGAILRQSDNNLYQIVDGQIKNKTLNELQMFMH